jgi:two-component system, OmpR family, sensor histidine kinase BaeS
LGEACVIRADRDKISQLFVNLISNALKYTDAGGQVDVEVKEDDTGARLTVRDSGIGIAAAELDRIFERFYRADKSRNRLTGGSGLGLAIAKAIVTAHGGGIGVASSPGEGSEFTVTLPKTD